MILLKESIQLTCWQLDRKYDLLKHPNVKRTKDDGGKPYVHGQADHFIEDWQNILLSDKEYEILTNEDMEDYFKENDSSDQ